MHQILLYIFVAPKDFYLNTANKKALTIQQNHNIHIQVINKKMRQDKMIGSKKDQGAYKDDMKHFQRGNRKMKTHNLPWFLFRHEKVPNKKLINIHNIIYFFFK